MLQMDPKKIAKKHQHRRQSNHIYGLDFQNTYVSLPILDAKIYRFNAGERR